MNYERLEKNLIDNIKEAQLKIGYDGHCMSLNYMKKSLENLLGGECSEEILAEFGKFTEQRLGKMTFRNIKDGVCITISAEGTEYVSKLGGYKFLEELIKKVSSHGISMNDVTAVFKRYSDNVTLEESRCEDFDILAYFPDKQPDEYYYCLTAEPCIGGGCHVIYHRFIREDYEEIFGIQ